MIGGVPGAGKSTVARRLAAEQGWACLSSDVVGKIVQTSPGVRNVDAVDAYWIAYDVVFGLAEELIGAGLSVVLDLNLGWPFQWEWLDSLPARHAALRVLPIVLRCPRAICLQRIRRRYAAEPAADGPERYAHDPRILGVFTFLEHLERPDLVWIDASGPAEEVYTAVRRLPLVVEQHAPPF